MYPLTALFALTVPFSVAVTTAAARRPFESVHARSTLHSRQYIFSKQTARNLLCPERTIIILLLCRGVRLALYLRRLRAQNMDCVLVSGVQIRLRGGHCDLDFIRVFSSLDDTEIRADFVITFRTPGDVAVRWLVAAGKGEISGENELDVGELKGLELVR
jgi:hypothetical protein